MGTGRRRQEREFIKAMKNEFIGGMHLLVLRLEFGCGFVVFVAPRDFN